ncbi:hypothetical protein BDR04DRAFT_1203066, partial [Suillus decipiens]
MHTISPPKPSENQVLEDKEASVRPLKEEDKRSMGGTQAPLATYTGCSCNTAKKHTAGETAKRVSSPLGSLAGSPVPAHSGVEGEVEVAWLDVHSQWCLICHDGAEGMLCSMSAVAALICHTWHTKKVPVPYHGFYSGTVLPKGGKPALPSFLCINMLAAVHIAVIHFILGGSNEIIMPVPFLSHYLSHYFPNGGYFYLEVPFDVAMHRTICSYTCTQEAHITCIKSHLTHNGCVFTFFSDHSEEDSGWLFAGKEKGSFVAMSVLQVLTTVLGPYSGVLQGAMMVFLVCGSIIAHDDSLGELQQTILQYNIVSAIIFSVTQFQPLVTTNFLLALVEQVIVEQLDISKAFPGLLALSSHLGWSRKVAVQAGDESQEPDVQDQVPVSRYLYACAYPECGKAQNKPSYKFHINKPPGFIVDAAMTNPPLLQDNISAKNNSKDEPVELPKALKKIYSISKAIRGYYCQFLTDKDDIQAEEEFLRDEPDNLSSEEREAAACPKDAAFYKKEISDWDVVQKLFKQEMDQYNKNEQEKLGVKNEIKYRTCHARDWFKSMNPVQRKEVEDAWEKWNREGTPPESQA